MKRRASMIVILFLIYVLMSSGGLILFKLGSKNLSFNINSTGFNLSLNWIMLCGILCYLCSFVLWLVIVSKMNLSVAMPISVGLVNVLVLVGSLLVLNEKISIMQWVGTGVIIFGLFLINLKG